MRSLSTGAALLIIGGLLTGCGGDGGTGPSPVDLAGV
jgi:hypothetical protein